MSRASLHLIVAAVEGGPALGEQGPPDAQEFRRLGVALVVLEIDAVARELGRAAADHDVQQQAALAQPVERCRLAGGEGRRGDAGPERHQELQPLRRRGEAGGGYPGILAELARGQEHAIEAEAVDGRADLAEIPEIGRPLLGLRAEEGTIAAGRDEPEEVERRWSKPQGGAHGWISRTGVRRSAVRCRCIARRTPQLCGGVQTASRIWIGLGIRWSL